MSSASLREAKAGAADCPVLIGSGLDPENASALMSLADGAIVGTSLKTGAWVDARKVKNLVAAARARSGPG